jgi:hypothetical protein
MFSFFIENLIAVITVFIFVLSIINYYFLSKNKINYLVMLIICFCYICLDVHLAIKHPDQKSLLLFVFLNAYAILMLVRGFSKTRKMSAVNRNEDVHGK